MNNPHVLEDFIVQRFSDANPPSFTDGSNHFSSRDATTVQMREIIGASAGAGAYVARMVATGKALPALTAGASATAITVADSLKDFYVTMYIVQDARLYTAMFPDITHWGSVLTQGINRYLLDMVLTIMYIAVPALFLFLVTLAGQRISGMGSSSGEMSNPLNKLRMGNMGK